MLRLSSFLLYSLLLSSSSFTQGSGAANNFSTEELFAPPPNYTVAFVGDTGVRSRSMKLLQRMKNDWNVRAVVHGGDLAYRSDQTAWWKHYDSVFPDASRTAFIGTSGNHDVAAKAARSGWGYDKTYWHRYAKDIRAREDASGAVCRGVPGEMEACHLHGLVIVNLGYGNDFDRYEEERSPADYAHFITAAFDAYPNAYWRICHFHQPVAPYAIDPRLHGHKVTDWSVMNACIDKGALVANAHHHSYSRTHQMSSYENETVSKKVDKNHELHTLRPGTSMQWVSGLGGHHPAPIDPELSEKPFFATRVAHRVLRGRAPPGTRYSDFGALICTFNPTGQPTDHPPQLSRADCQFRDIRNHVYDQFTMYSLPLEFEPSAPWSLEGVRILDAEEARWQRRSVHMANAASDKATLESDATFPDSAASTVARVGNLVTLLLCFIFSICVPLLC